MPVCLASPIQRKALQTGNLEDGELRIMLASALYLQNREDYESSRMPIATVKPAALLHERRASAKRAQADLWKGLMSSSSQEPTARVKPAALCSWRSEEPGNQFKSSDFRNADPLNVGRSLLEGIKDHLLSQAKSEVMRQEHQVRYHNNCISELSYSNMLLLKDWILQDAQDGCIESRREQDRLQEELSMKEKVLRNTQIRSVHEMGEMKRAQELRVDEVSAQKLRKKSRDNTEAHFPVAGDARADEFNE